MRSVEISVIIPNYNNAHYLSDCLESILRQSFKNIEIIIADDCSTDGSVDLIKNYADKYPDIIKPVLNTKNMGVSRNRHNAISRSRGEYITTLDSDDMYADENKLEREYSLIKKYENNESRNVIAFSNVRYLFSDLSQVDAGTPENIREGDIFQSLLLRNCFIPRDFLFKREIYARVGGYDPSYKIYEDWNLKLKLAKHYPFYYTGITGVIYRRHKQGLSAQGVKVHLKYLRRSFSEAVFSVNDSKMINELKSDFEKYLMDTFKTGYRKESNLKRIIFMIRSAMIRGRNEPES